jgi:type IV pilus assembly protein PilP
MRKIFAGLTVLTILLFPVKGRMQEEKESPSQKTKEAIDKLKKAPEAIGKKLEALRDAVTTKLQGTGDAKTQKAEEDLTLPKRKTSEPERPRYSPAGQRDPFRPMTLKTKVRQRSRESLSPLERYELGQLKLVGIVWDVKEPRAMVEDSTGLGYIVQPGTLIGPNEGKVKAIKPAEVLIEESYIDFYGAKKSREVSMKLAAE